MRHVPVRSHSNMISPRLRVVPPFPSSDSTERGNRARKSSAEIERGSVGVRALSGKWNVDQLLRRSYQILRKFEDMFKLSDMDEILFKLC